MNDNTPQTCGRVITMTSISRAYVRAHPTQLFLFSDNLAHVGMGATAFSIRGEPNSIGIPTKHSPDNHPRSFFTDSIYDDIRQLYDHIFRDLEHRLRTGTDIIVPSSGIGTGRAALPTKAPRIFNYLVTRLAHLQTISKNPSYRRPPTDNP